MKRFWFRVMINKKESKVVKVLVQAPDYNEAEKVLRNVIALYYPNDTDLDILNIDTSLEDDVSYAIIGEGKSTHYLSARSIEIELKF